MGILDDAIREHLDLKRRQGVEDAELAKLEDEAFGPPSRPGDPDFPEEGATATAEPVTGGAAAEAVPAAPAEEPPTDAGLEVPAAEPIESRPEPDVPVTSDEAATPEPEPEPSGFYDYESQAVETAAPAEEAAAPPEPASEPVSEELPLEDAPPAVEPDPTPTPPEPEPVAVEPEPTPIEPEQVVEPEPEVQPPIESLDTVEHHFEEAIPDTGESEAVEVVEGELTDDEPKTAAEGEDDEDVLEETPEFLRDQPEDDELWFEQGEPKDFDF